MRAQTVLILGGGVGGVVAANALRKRLHRRHRILLVDRKPTFALAASFLWIMTGTRRPAQISRPLERLKRKGIEVRGYSLRATGYYILWYALGGRGPSQSGRGLPEGPLGV